LKIKTFILSFAFACLLVTNAWAEHEADHRYNVRGYVLDENQQGISGVNVQIFMGSQLLASIATDADGYYSLHLHLHNADRGETLLLSAGQHKAELGISFDASDLTTARVHEANFIDGVFSEEPLGRFRMPSWVYPIGGLLLLVIVAVILESRRKKKIRLKIKDSLSQQQPSRHKSKKGRRKKR